VALESVFVVFFLSFYVYVLLCNLCFRCFICMTCDMSTGFLYEYMRERYETLLPYGVINNDDHMKP